VFADRTQQKDFISQGIDRPATDAVPSLPPSQQFPQLSTRLLQGGDNENRRIQP
jgi:hypothetical protein